MDDDAVRLSELATPVGEDDFEPLSSTVRVDIAARSHRGQVLPHNEDHYLVVRLGRRQETLATSLSSVDIPRRFEEFGYEMLVADGFGSGGAGSVASRVALSTLAHMALHYGRWNLRIDPKIAEEVMRRARWLFEQAGVAIANQRHERAALSNMGTSLTAAYTAGDDLFVAHVGHSRAYLFRHGMLTQLTRDDTAERHHASRGGPIAVGPSGRDLRHVLTDAIGASRNEPPVVDVEHFRLADGDCLLLCSNGLTDMVDDARIAEILAARRRSAEQCRELVSLANRMGGKDNITIVVGQYDMPSVRHLA